MHLQDYGHPCQHGSTREYTSWPYLRPFALSHLARKFDLMQIDLPYVELLQHRNPGKIKSDNFKDGHL